MKTYHHWIKEEFGDDRAVTYCDITIPSPGHYILIAPSVKRINCKICRSRKDEEAKKDNNTKQVKLNGI